MIEAAPAAEQAEVHQCIGYAAFTVRLEEPSFARCFDRLEQDI